MRIVAVAFVLREIIFYKKGSARVSNWPANLTGQTTLPAWYGSMPWRRRRASDPPSTSGNIAHGIGPLALVLHRLACRLAPLPPKAKSSCLK